MAVAKIDPKVIFASEAPAQDTPAVFTNKTVGWGESRKNGGRPTIKQSNALQQETDLKILWLNENSVTPFDATIDYPENAVTIKDGAFKILKSGVWGLFLDKSSVGLNNVDNTSDLNKPVSTAVQTALNLKADKSTTYTKVEVNNALDLLKPPHLSSDVVDGNQTQDQINLYGGKKYDMPVGGYPLNARVLLDNGDIVKSTVGGNTNDPNVDMTGWVNSELEQKFKTAEILTPEMFGAVGDNVTDDTQALIDMFKACTNMPIGSGISANEIGSKLNSNNYKVVRLTKRYRHTKPIHIPPNIRIEQCVSGFFSKNNGTNGLFYDPIDSELDTYAVAPFLYKKDSDGTYSLDTSPYTLPSGGAFDRAEYIQTGQRILIEGLSVITKQGVTLGFRFVGFSGSIANYINVGTNDGSSSRVPKVAILTNACWNTVFTKPTTLSSHQGWVNWGSNGGMTVSNPYINFGYSAQAVSEITPVYNPINHTEKGAIAVVNAGDAEWYQPITEGWYFNYVATHYLRVMHPHIEGARTRNAFYFIGSADSSGGVAADITLKPVLTVDLTNVKSSIIYLKDCDIQSAIYLRGRPLGAAPVVRGENSSACVHIDISRNHYFINAAKWGDLNLIRTISKSWGDTTVYVDPIGGDDEFIGMRESKALKSLKFAKRLCDLIGADTIHIVNDVTYSETVDIPKNVTFTGKAIIGAGNALLRVNGLDTNVRFNNTKLSHASQGVLYLNSLTTGNLVFNCELECTQPYIQAQNTADIDITIQNNNLSPRPIVYGNTSYQQAVGLNIKTTATLANILTTGNAFIKYSNLNTATIAYDPPSLAAGESVTTTVIMPATAVGSVVSAAFSQYNADVKIVEAIVSAANTVLVTFKNTGSTNVDLVSGTLTVKKL